MKYYLDREFRSIAHVMVFSGTHAHHFGSWGRCIFLFVDI